MKTPERNLPVGWAFCEVDDIGELIRGITYKKEQASNCQSSELLPILRANNINGDLNFNDLVYVPRSLIAQDQLIKKGDIIFAMSSGSLHLVGKSAQARTDFAGSCGAFCSILRIDQKISEKYAGFLFQGNKFRRMISEIAKGSNINNLKREHVLGYNFELPPLAEQRRIVSKIEELFSELDKGIETLKTAKAQLAVYRQAILKDAFEGKLTAEWRSANYKAQETAELKLLRIRAARRKNHTSPGKYVEPPEVETNDLPEIPGEWCWARLDLVGIVGSGMSVSKDRQLEDPIEVPYLRVANVQRGRLDLSEMKTMKVERDALNELRLQSGDILFNEGGDRDKLGRGWVWEEQFDPCITQNHVFRVTPIDTEIIDPFFVSHWGNSFGQQFFLRNGKQTTNLASINKSVLSSLPVPIPSITEQRLIVSQIEELNSSIGHLEADIETNLLKSEALRQSILKKAFAGELVPQDPSDEPASVLLDRIRADRDAMQNRGSKKSSPKKPNVRGRKPKAATI